MNQEPSLKFPRSGTLNREPINGEPIFLLSVLIGVVWCSLVLFGPKFYFHVSGSDIASAFAVPAGLGHFGMVKLSFVYVC